MDYVIAIKVPVLPTLAIRLNDSILTQMHNKFSVRTLDAMFRRTDAMFRRTDAMFRRTDAMFRRTNAKR